MSRKLRRMVPPRAQQQFSVCGIGMKRARGTCWDAVVVSTAIDAFTRVGHPLPFYSRSVRVGDHSATAFPAPSSPDKSEAGLRLRISFLFWLTIRGFPPPVRMVFGRLLVLVRSKLSTSLNGFTARPGHDRDQRRRMIFEDVNFKGKKIRAIYYSAYSKKGRLWPGDRDCKGRRGLFMTRVRTRVRSRSSIKRCGMRPITVHACPHLRPPS